MWTWNPARDFERLENEMLGLFSGVSGTIHEYPAVNVWSNENEAVLTAELPGVDTNQLDISVQHDILTLRGSRKPLEVGQGESYHRRERMQGEFTRVVSLPFRVDAEHVSASVQKGVLTITLPRAPEDKPRKIEVKAA